MDQCVVIGMSFCICMPNFVVIRWRSYDVISIFLNGGHKESEIYFRVQVL